MLPVFRRTMPLTRIALDEFLPGSLLLVEEDTGDIKRVFAQMLAAEAIDRGKRVTYITTRMKSDVLKEISAYGIKEIENLEVIERTRDHTKLSELCSGDVCVIEGFPFFFLDAVDRELLSVVNALSHSCRKNNKIILLTADNGIMPDKQHKMVRSIVDGVIQITMTLMENRISRYIMVHKLRGMGPEEKMIPFSIDDSGRNVYIDTRERYA
jgi:archaellum biogenesis ATPase FlaH